MRWLRPEDYVGDRNGLRLVASNIRTPHTPRSTIGMALGLALMVSVGGLIGISWPIGEGKAIGPTVSVQRFGLCHTGGGQNCVVDGDTFYIGGEKIRLAGIDAPETHPPRCEREAELGKAATNRLRDMLNQGPVTLVASADRDRDKYGRLLRDVERNGESLGDVLIDEGLARPYSNGRLSWC